MAFHLLNSAEKIPLAPVIALVGPEAYLRERSRKSLIDRALGGALREMNFASFQAGEDEVSKALNACRDYPCFAEKRVVLLTDIQKIKKKEAADLISYLEAPVTSTILILEDEKVDGRLDWVKVLKKNSEFIEIPELHPEEARLWVQKCFQKEGKRASEEVWDQLVEWVGNSMGALKLGVEQLCLYVGDRPEVNRQDVENLLVKVTEENVFKVIDCLFTGNLAELHRSLDALLEGGEAPLKILALIHRHLSILLALKFSNPNRAASLFRLSPYIRAQYEKQVKQYQDRVNLSLLAPVAKTDLSLKGSALPGELVLKHCVEEIIALLAKR